MILCSIYHYPILKINSYISKPSICLKLLLGSLFILGLHSCNRFDGKGFNFSELEPQSEERLQFLLDTTKTLPYLTKLNKRQRVDSLIYFSEWLKYYDEDMALYYGQEAFDLATEENWGFARGVAANRLAALKLRTIDFGEGIEEVMVDARISRRLLKSYNNLSWNANNDQLFGTIFLNTGQIDSARYYLEQALQKYKQLDQPSFEDQATVLQNLLYTYPYEDSIRYEAYFEKSDSLYELSGDSDLSARHSLNKGIFYRYHRNYETAESYFIAVSDYAKVNQDINLQSEVNIERAELYTYKYDASADSMDFNLGMNLLRKCLETQTDNVYRVYELMGNFYQFSWYHDVDEAHVDSAIVYYKKSILAAKKEGAFNVMRLLTETLISLNDYFESDRVNLALEEPLEDFINDNYLGMVNTFTGITKNAYIRINDIEQRDIKLNSKSKK